MVCFAKILILRTRLNFYVSCLFLAVFKLFYHHSFLYGWINSNFIFYKTVIFMCELFSRCTSHLYVCKLYLATAILSDKKNNKQTNFKNFLEKISNILSLPFFKFVRNQYT